MLKYNQHLISINNCPGSSCQPLFKSAIRFVSDPIEANSFIPVAIKQPSRTFKRVQDQCSSFGLSMYGNEVQARLRYSELAVRWKNIRNGLGDTLARVDLEPTLGVCSIEQSNGHFDFFEFNTCNLVNHSSIVGTI